MSNNELTQMWRDHRKTSQKKRAHNRVASAGRLREAGIDFVRKNGGAHLVITTNQGYIDFWPGTGKYILRYKEGKRGHGRGVAKLIKEIGGKTK